MARKQKLELTWIGKEIQCKIEPRVLIERSEHSYCAENIVDDNCIYDNMLIHGDNLLALKALESEFTGKIKCIYIDPPFNTGQAFDHYDDGLEHSIWLSLMRDRLCILKNLLSDDGSIWITLDDNEVHYLKVLCDELFGRSCFVASPVWRTSDNSNNNATTFSLDHNYTLIYSKKPNWKPNFINDSAKRRHFKNPDNDPRGPWFDGNPVNNPGLRPNLQYNITAPNGTVIKHPPNGWRWSWETIQEKMKTGEIRFSNDGSRIIRRTYLKDQEGLPPSTLWVDLERTGHNRQAKYELKTLFPDTPVTSLLRTPKPEKLIAYILDLATDPGDLVLDSFLGSGTTAAVAHKMNRRWIGIELGEHCYSHCIPRLKQVIDGTDLGGVTTSPKKKAIVKLCKTCKETICEDCAKKIGEDEKGGELLWKGGGGFRFFELGPSLIANDQWGNPVINPEFNPAMLAEAMCKLEGFTYAPSDEFYWIHGHSTEADFIYVTTQFMSREMLTRISDEVGTERSLLVCCTAFKCDPGEFTNLTLKKIPKAVLKKCEWGHDDYSLAVENLPDAPPEPDPERNTQEKSRIRRFGKASQQLSFLGQILEDK